MNRQNRTRKRGRGGKEEKYPSKNRDNTIDDDQCIKFAIFRVD